MPTPGELVALCGLFFVAAMIYIGVRFVRETKAQRASEAATKAEIQRRAALAGRTFENGVGETEWIQTGATAAGHAWTLRYVIAQVRTLDRQGRTGVARDTIQGQKLEWHCPAMAGAEAFTFYSFRVAEDNDPQELKFDPEDRLMVEVAREGARRSAGACPYQIPAAAAPETTRGRAGSWRP